jgi:hypothetical protein
VQCYALLGNHDIRRGTELQIHYPAWNMTGRRFYEFSKAIGADGRTLDTFKVVKRPPTVR